MSAKNILTRRRFVAFAGSAAALAVFPFQPNPCASAPVHQGDTMTKLMPYLLFDGTCSDAMQFYQSVFGGQLSIAKVKDSPAKDRMPAFQHEKTLNAHLQSGDLEISASDWLAANATPLRGNTVCLFLSGGAPKDLKALFEKLSQGAQVTDPLKEVFFGLYGALNDKFGVRWMFQTSERSQ